MKNTLIVLLLAGACLALGIGLIYRHRQAVAEKSTDTQSILTYSNKWVDTSMKLDEQKQDTVALQKALTTTNDFIAQLTNELTKATSSLAKTTSDLDAARKSIQEAQEEVQKRDARIADLEAQNVNLDKRAGELTNAIAGLNFQISETKRKLAASEGNRAYLEKELRRLMSEKDDLEKKFADLEVLRAQVKKLREDLAVARRIDWIRKGLWSDPDQRGATLLLSRPKPATSTVVNTNKYDLNVEIGSDGTVRTIPPATNRPPANPPPEK